MHESAPRSVAIEDAPRDKADSSKRTGPPRRTFDGAEGLPLLGEPGERSAAGACAQHHHAGTEEAETSGDGSAVDFWRCRNLRERHVRRRAHE